MVKNSLKFLVLILAFSQSAFANDGFNIRLFGLELSIPSTYVVTPSGYGDNTKVRLIDSKNAEFSWVEVRIESIQFCGQECHKTLEEAHGSPISSGKSVKGVHWIRFQIEESSTESVFYIYDDTFIVKVLNDEALANFWILELNKAQ